MFCFFFCFVYIYSCFIFFFFFSSRRRHTRSLRDWSSDVCSSDLASQPAGCPYQAPQTCPASTPTYQADVLPILQTKCNDCHTGADGGPWPLTDYQLVVDWKISILGDLECNTMPPADAGLALTSDERTTLLAWLVCG